MDTDARARCQILRGCHLCFHEEDTLPDAGRKANKKNLLTYCPLCNFTIEVNSHFELCHPGFCAFCQDKWNFRNIQSGANKFKLVNISSSTEMDVNARARVQMMKVCHLCFHKEDTLPDASLHFYERKANKKNLLTYCPLCNFSFEVISHFELCHPGVCEFCQDKWTFGNIQTRKNKFQPVYLLTSIEMDVDARARGLALIEELKVCKICKYTSDHIVKAGDHFYKCHVLNNSNQLDLCHLCDRYFRKAITHFEVHHPDLCVLCQKNYPAIDHAPCEFVMEKSHDRFIQKQIENFYS